MYCCLTTGLGVCGASYCKHSPMDSSYKLLGGSWVVISGIISPLIWVRSIVTLLITPLITTHEPPSSRPF